MVRRKGELLLCSVMLVASTHANGYWDIQLGPQSVSSVPYDRGFISVWEHATSKGRYYAMPLVILDHQSARTIENILTAQHELNFDVLMWSLEAKETVSRHLKATLNLTVVDVELLPMEKIRILWRDRDRPIASYYKLNEHWKSNTHLPTKATFKFSCTETARCNQLQHVMKTAPSTFDALELEYVINGQRSARRDMTVTGQHITEGKLFTKLANMAEGGGDRYINSNDLKTIVSESVSNVISSVVTDSDYVDTGDEVSMKDVLMAELQKQQVSSDNFQPHMWDSVFWNPAWARPDKITNYLNKVISKDKSDSRNFILDENAAALKFERSHGASVLGMLGSKSSVGGSSNSQSKVQKEDVLNVLEERHGDVEWTGEVFRVKPMKLYRLNLSTLKSKANVATANVQVSRYETVQSIKLRIDQTLSKQTPSLTPQLVEARLMEKIRESEARMRQSEARMRKSEARMGQFEDRWEASWPQSARFCIWKSGDCPPGFDWWKGWAAYQSFTDNSLYRVTLGSSFIIQTRGSGGLSIHVCCRE